MYDSVLGEGEVLYSQILTIFTILITALLWILIFKKTGRKRILKLVAIPLIIWIVFGTLDIVVTAKGTYNNPYKEGNPLSRQLFIWFGFYGPAISAFLWITLWAGLSLVFDMGSKVLPQWFRDLIQLWIFYSLAVGHFFAFHSWMNWGKSIRDIGFGYHKFLPFTDTEMGWTFFPWIILGFIIAAGHTIIIHRSK
jgi:hypothetical protein